MRYNGAIFLKGTILRKKSGVMFLVRLLVKYPKLLLAAMLAASGVYLYEVQIARPKMVYMGIPETKTFAKEHFTRIFRNRGYMVGYSDWRGNPLWVSYKLIPTPAAAKSLKRPDRFSADWRNLTFITHEHYTQSGYDRGHMAPNSAISKRYGKTAQEETFLMTNITPQKPNLNQKVWQRLEALESETFANAFDELWVVTGPIFDEKVQRLKSSSFVEIPDAFYKLYAGVKAGHELKLLAFVIPQNVRGNEKLGRFVSTVDEVEKLTGFDFWHGLDDTLEARLESRPDRNGWGL